MFQLHRALVRFQCTALVSYTRMCIDLKFRERLPNQYPERAAATRGKDGPARLIALEFLKEGKVTWTHIGILIW